MLEIITGTFINYVMENGGSIMFANKTYMLPRAILICSVTLAASLLSTCYVAEAATAVPVSRFLNSIGVVSSFPDRGQPIDKTVEMLRYGGFRWVRAGIEGLTDSGPTNMQAFLDLSRASGAKLSWGLVSGSADIDKLLRTAKILHRAGALLSFEGNNEPNNWGVVYKGEPGGRQDTWMPVANLQRDLYAAIKSDQDLSKYPVWGISEAGAQRDNVGLQYLKIPAGAKTKMPDGTAFADYANVHNYIYHQNAPYPADNKTWDAADPTASSKIDGLYGNYGVTWGRGFYGYNADQLEILPRVTTETGVAIGGAITENIQAANLVNMYLSQFKRGYAYTSVYLLRDRTDETGNQSFGFFKADYSPRLSAKYLHNLTTILTDNSDKEVSGQLNYEILEQPSTVHDLLLRRSDGTFQLVIWDERLSAKDNFTVRLDQVHDGVSLYDIKDGVQPSKQFSGVSMIDLALTDHPVVISIPAFK